MSRGWTWLIGNLMLIQGRTSCIWYQHGGLHLNYIWILTYSDLLRSDYLESLYTPQTANEWWCLNHQVWLVSVLKWTFAKLHLGFIFTVKPSITLQQFVHTHTFISQHRRGGWIRCPTLTCKVTVTRLSSQTGIVVAVGSGAAMRASDQGAFFISVVTTVTNGGSPMSELHITLITRVSMQLGFS